SAAGTSAVSSRRFAETNETKRDQTRSKKASAARPIDTGAPPPDHGIVSVSAKKWLCGLDLRPSSQGAIRWARWLAQRTGADTLAGVHVLEEAHLQAALRYHHLQELTDTARDVAGDVLTKCGATSVMSTVD